MILVDSSVWIDHLHQRDETLFELLHRNAVAMHPAVRIEIALGSIRNRAPTLADLGELPHVAMASEREVLRLIDVESLYSAGLNYVDVHLLASAMISPGAAVWTRDRRLEREARRLGVAWNPRA